MRRRISAVPSGRHEADFAPIIIDHPISLGKGFYALSRFAPRAGLVIVCQTFVRRGQNCVPWVAMITRWGATSSASAGWQSFERAVMLGCSQTAFPQRMQ